MSLQSELDEFGKRIAGFSEPPGVSDEQWQKFADNTVVALMAGGESSRYAAVAGQSVQKNAHELPNGDTMIEMAIRAYRDAGIKKFVALVYYAAETVKERLGDGSSLSVEITYCQDPEPPAGKGGAIRHALDTGAIPAGCNLIVANPDDVILDFPGSYARFIGECHLAGQAKGMLATAVLAAGQPYPSTGMMVVDGRIVDSRMYPMIPVPAHVGISIFSPEILPRFAKLFDLGKKNEFEQILFPILAKENKLWAAGLTRGNWLAVNDLKSYNQLIKKLED